VLTIPHKIAKLHHDDNACTCGHRKPESKQDRPCDKQLSITNSRQQVDTTLYRPVL